ncbi:MAG: hypothetical protein PVH61_11020 [Candidatus Aminicenantes bacterium]|jgi:ATP-dependent DNA helicase RecG
MPLPINVDDLITGQSTEWERLEFKQNGSPDPLFQTDEQLTYFLTVLYSHPDFTGQDKDFKENGTVSGTVNEIQNG